MASVKNSTTQKHGFTLIELMVATAIMAVLVLAVMGVTSHVLSTWSSASGRLGANAEARTALQYLGDDLETLVVRPKQQTWLEVTYENNPVPGQGTVRVPNISLISATEHRARAAGDSGNICAINYKLAFRNPIVGGTAEPPSPPPVAGLYRKVIDPQQTFNQVLTTATGSEPISLTNTIDGIGGNTDAFANFLSSNVADLSIDFYAEDLDEAVDSLNRVKKIEGDFMYSDKIYEETDSGINWGRILYADIRMTVVSDEGAKAMAVASITGRDTKDIIQQHGTVFSRRVPILSRH